MTDSEDNIANIPLGELKLTGHAPTFTNTHTEVIKALNSVSEKANINKYELEKAVQSINPSFINYARLITKQKVLNASVFVLALALSRCSIDINVNIDGNELISQIFNISRDKRYENVTSNQEPERTKTTSNTTKPKKT